MRRSQFDYRSYRGRKTANDWLKRITVILSVLVVIVIAALLLGQKYISYTDGGMQIRLPFSQQSENKTPDPGTVSVVEGTPDASSTQEDPSSAPAEEPTVTASVTVPVSALADGTAQSLEEQAGANSVIADLKNDQGELGWNSQEALASQVQDGIDVSDINADLTTWNEGGLYTIARLSCFKDRTLGADMNYTLRTTSGYRWRDAEDGHWTAADNGDVQDYLIGLMTELARMGFDEILLEHWGYPSQEDGMLSNLARPEDPSSVVGAFLGQAAQALEPYGTKLSLVVTQAELTGADTASGLTAAAANDSGERLWMSGDRTELLAALTQVGIERPEERLVLLSSQLDPETSWSQAMWSGE